MVDLEDQLIVFKKKKPTQPVLFHCYVFLLVKMDELFWENFFNDSINTGSRPMGPMPLDPTLRVGSLPLRSAEYFEQGTFFLTMAPW